MNTHHSDGIPFFKKLLPALTAVLRLPLGLLFRPVMVGSVFGMWQLGDVTVNWGWTSKETWIHFGAFPSSRKSLCRDSKTTD